MDAFVVTGVPVARAIRRRRVIELGQALTARDAERLDEARRTLADYESRLARELGEDGSARWSIAEVSKALRLLAERVKCGR